MIQSQLTPMEELPAKRQTNRGEYDENGMPEQPRFTTFRFKGNVQPISGFEFLQVPEGDRSRQILNIFTETELKADDIVERDGNEYEVRAVENWKQDSLHLSHFKARAVKKDV